VPGQVNLSPANADRTRANMVFEMNAINPPGKLANEGWHIYPSGMEVSGIHTHSQALIGTGCQNGSKIIGLLEDITEVRFQQ
jgi:hypothetical protein